MDTRGLVLKYKVNRPLTDKETDHYLPPGEQSCLKPLYHKQVIRMNSTYLEIVDKFFADRGMMSAVMIFSVGVCLLVLYFTYLMAFEKREYGYAFLLFAMFLPLLFIGIKLLLKECFTYTHFPIRFNRKTRKVHVFRQNGTVMTEDWEKLYFTLVRCEGMDAALWGVLGHRMAEDGVIVLETFGLPTREALNRNRSNTLTWSMWEFIRRYMEEPDELPALAAQVETVPDIADRREGYIDGFIRLYSDTGIVGIVLAPITLPVGVCYALGRWIAHHTSKIPQWPAEVEAECQIDPDDPHIRDAKTLAALQKPDEGSIPYT
jgi:hypothetical protein